MAKKLVENLKQIVQAALSSFGAYAGNDSWFDQWLWFDRMTTLESQVK